MRLLFFTLATFAFAMFQVVTHRISTRSSPHKKIGREGWKWIITTCAVFLLLLILSEQVWDAYQTRHQERDTRLTAPVK